MGATKHGGLLMGPRTDLEVSEGFDAGNYANNYETTDLGVALSRLSMNRSEAYRAAFTLGFFASHEPHEMGEHELAYRNALQSDAGQRCIELGYVESWPGDLQPPAGFDPDND